MARPNIIDMLRSLLIVLISSFNLAHDNTFGDTDKLLNNDDINQAWVDFSVTDNVNLKLGRQAVEIGNGAIIGRHDHLQNPYSYDGWVLSSSYDDISL